MTELPITCHECLNWWTKKVSHVPDLPAERIARFLAAIHPQADGCWLYGSGDSDAYHFVTFHERFTFGAHRVMWKLVTGEDVCPATTVVHHRCERKNCVNPVHLQALSNAAHKAAHRRLREVPA